MSLPPAAFPCSNVCGSRQPGSPSLARVFRLSVATRGGCCINSGYLARPARCVAVIFILTLDLLAGASSPACGQAYLHSRGRRRRLLGSHACQVWLHRPGSTPARRPARLAPFQEVIRLVLAVMRIVPRSGMLV